MATLSQQNAICKVCEKEFSSTSTRNRHLKKFHPEFLGQEHKKHIICPMCTNNTQTFSYFTSLNKHLLDIHDIMIKQSFLNFKNLEEYTSWRVQCNREGDYACQTRNKFKNGEEHIFYNCNRSNIRGFNSSCKMRSCKSGGSIRIQGTCPSRILVKILMNGSIDVTFFETHAGHVDKLRTKRLSKAEENIIVGKLNPGSSTKEGEDTVLFVDEPTISQTNYQDDVSHFIRETLKMKVNSSILKFEEKREIALQGMCNQLCSYGSTLDENAFATFMTQFNNFKNKAMEQEYSHSSKKKRKTEQKMYYPNKK
ncbi:uncharacterized protein LOC126734009 [Anthonomus grandis grandis]|uniref:uncharacterized protein LOC126734009 n=1 Tax=Anthonomus grandis grandis TaxID=2921223 RepID=UPI00216613ED|nr:uncharacterized protein LOC126734009 [Anthonomus grandis grandis]